MSVTVLSGDIGNSAEATVQSEIPYMVDVTIQGSAAILFHRYQADEVEAKSKAKKGSKEKKNDNVEAYVYRDKEGYICIPGEYLRGSVIDKKNGAAKYRQDPRSTRKSALDLYKGGVLMLTDLAPILVNGKPSKVWEFEDRRGVGVNNARVTRTRPGFHAGWTAQFRMLVQTPTLIGEQDLHDVLIDGGRLVGIGDFRPTFGRFQVVNYQRVELK